MTAVICTGGIGETPLVVSTGHVWIWLMVTSASALLGSSKTPKISNPCGHRCPAATSLWIISGPRCPCFFLITWIAMMMTLQDTLTHSDVCVRCPVGCSGDPTLRLDDRRQRRGGDATPQHDLHCHLCHRHAHDKTWMPLVEVAC